MQLQGMDRGQMELLMSLRVLEMTMPRGPVLTSQPMDSSSPKSIGGPIWRQPSTWAESSHVTNTGLYKDKDLGCIESLIVGGFYFEKGNDFNIHITQG